MILALTAGAMVGLGTLLVIRAVFPPKPSLSVVLAHVNGGAGRVATVGGPRRSGWSEKVGPPVARFLERLGLEVGELEADLAVIGRPVEHHMALRAAGATIGFGGVILTGLVAGLAGAPISPITAGWVGIGGALIGFVLPDTTARRAAVERRRTFREALAFFLDLVSVTLAGGAGVSTALRQASDAGDGWAHLQIRSALRQAQVQRQPAWVALGQLGAELGISELEELGSAVALAEGEGASVRQSLAAKAASIRDHQLADAEANAASATVRMAAPLVLLGMSFCAFVLYGAINSVFTP
jgi:Flp pilus assembly protein TadB